MAKTWRSKKNIIWFITKIGEGSGGQRTVFQNISYLSEIGYNCTIHLEDEQNVEEARKKILKWYGINFFGRIVCGDLKNEKFDVAIATYYTTARDAAVVNALHKIYFVQDYEPWFFPMSEDRLEARRSYTLGLRVITIGKWLAKMIKDKFDLKMTNYFRFCADLNVYRRINEIEKENAVCFVLQPSKPWRCTNMGLKALQIVQSMRPDVKIYFYGSKKTVPFNIRAKHLGLLSVQECNKLYNKCKVGLCLSSTNPSRIPFEMMAAGLPVVDLYLENNLYDFPECGCLLAEPSAESIAAAILQILDDDNLRKSLAQGGEKYMRDFPLQRGFKEFGEIIDACFCGKKMNLRSVRKIYQRACVKSDEKCEVGDVVYFRTMEDIEQERKAREAHERAERAKKEEEEWRKNLTTKERIFLKIRYIFLGR